MLSDSDGGTELGRRDRRKRNDRRQILAAARRLIAEEGLANVRIAHVTERADVGFGTFYTHFESKDAMIEAVVAEAVAAVAQLIATRAMEFADPAETAAIAFRRFVRFAIDAPDFAGVLVRLENADRVFEDAMRPHALQALARGMATDRFHIADVELAVSFVSATALMAIRGVLAGRFDPDPGAAGAQMMLQGLGVEADAAAEIARRSLPLIPLDDESDDPRA